MFPFVIVEVLSATFNRISVIFLFAFKLPVLLQFE